MILFFFSLFRPPTELVGLSDNYAREGLATAECDFTEREAAWTGFLYTGSFKKEKDTKKRPYLILFFKSLSRVGGWSLGFYGEALPRCCI